MKTKNALQWVPSINTTPQHKLKPNSLVRYRCMIQDMFDPEFYLGAYEVKDTNSGEVTMKSGKYKDIAQCGVNQSIDVNSKNNITMDRMTLYCVPVPGETEWVKKAYADQCKLKTKCYPSTSKTPARFKRSLEEEDSDGSHDNIQMEECSGVANGDSEPGTVGMETGDSKRQQTERPVAGSSTEPDLNFPLPGEQGPACIVKVYDDINSFKVNDVMEFVGILSVDPALARFDSPGDENAMLGVVEESLEEQHAHSPPPSLVPRLHAVLHTDLQHVNPLVPPADTEDHRMVLETCQMDVGTLRTQTLAVLEHALLGDKLAAEYLLCYLLSSVYGRADVIPLGKFCLNLSNCPWSSGYADLLHHLISNLVTQSHLLKMTLANMNELRFSPTKDYTANRLCSGILQLASHTNLVIDETALQPGQLDVNGVRNMQALGNLISWQKVEYDFNFHRQDFLANVSSLIVSEGKSILPSDCWVPVQVQAVEDNLRNHFMMLDPQLTDDFLTRCRTYLGLATHMQYTLTDDLQKKIQDDFVEMRKDDPKSLSVDDFHALLSLTRMLSLSNLQEHPTLDTWTRAKQMEKERKARVSQIVWGNRTASPHS